MSFFVKDENVRPGNRGGRDQFKWDNIRLLNNKDRESYLGVTQSLGFLDKGGKWRKRDWWMLQNEGGKIDHDFIKKEKEAIKKEEERQMRESLYPGLKEKNQKAAATINPNTSNVVAANNQMKAKLTDYEWKELMKKEANFNPDDSKLFEFYENDDKRAGIGMKANVSFRTNPYTEKNLSKLEGIGLVENQGEKNNEEEDDNPYVTIDEKQTENKKNPSIVEKYIKEYIKEKKEKINLVTLTSGVIDGKEDKSENVNKDKNDKKEKKHKKDKHKSRSRSRHRSNSRDHKHKHKHRHSKTHK